MKTESPATLGVPLSGWGRYPFVESYLQRPEKISGFKHILRNSARETFLARGGGRSYGDAGLNNQGQTLLTERINRILSFDSQTGRLACEAGVTFQELLQVFIPKGWFPTVTPGTKFVTLGGAVAFDVHGKNHHQDSSFCHHIQSLKVLLASGETVLCSREDKSELFWATVGGMGLTGVILEVEFDLQRIETAYIQSHNIKAKNLDDAIALFDQYEPQYQYSVAWIDCLSTGKNLGRSILMLGNHAEIPDLPPSQQTAPLKVQAKNRLSVPFNAPSGLLNRYTMKSFNTLYYAKQQATEVHRIVDYDSFFYPLDFLENWNRLYGKQGFVQYQFVVPTENSREALIQVLQLCADQGKGSFLAVLKRLGAQAGLLSFPIPGYTLTLDIPVKPGLWLFLDQLDQIVMQYEGRVYLAKDARLSPEVFRKMYPDFPQWLAIKSQVDPKNRFCSQMSRRLKIEPN